MRNFLVTTGLVDTWELNENNFFLGKWCELYEIDKYIDNKIPDKVSIIKNNHHWFRLRILYQRTRSHYKQ